MQNNTVYGSNRVFVVVREKLCTSDLNRIRFLTDIWQRLSLRLNQADPLLWECWKSTLDTCHLVKPGDFGLKVLHELGAKSLGLYKTNGRFPPASA